MRHCNFILFCLAVILISCASQNTAIISSSTLRTAVNQKVYVTRDIDLRKETVNLHEGVTLVSKGGVIKNGTLVGNGTMIEGDSAIFDHVTVQGSWNVPEISTALFRDLSYENSLRDVVALSSDKVQNTVTVKPGSYSFTFTKNAEVGIAPASNTNMVIDGTLTLKPNAFKNYYIVNLKGDNIHLSGSGVIQGDKNSHTAKEGEWGMGIQFNKASNCSVTGLTIKDCWGDCIYIAGKSTNCTIDNCTLDNGRRQGISITSAEGVTISDCKISNVSGTGPGYAIDLEPNKDDIVKNVTMTNVTVDNCTGGFLIFTRKDNTDQVENISFDKCTVNSVGTRSPMAFTRCKSVKVTGCKLLDGRKENAVALDSVDGVVFNGNTIKASKYAIRTITGVTFQNNTVVGAELYPAEVKKTITSKTASRFKGNKVVKQ